jgi:hypothetical protein
MKRTRAASNDDTPSVPDSGDGGISKSSGSLCLQTISPGYHARSRMKKPMEEDSRLPTDFGSLMNRSAIISYLSKSDQTNMFQYVNGLGKSLQDLEKLPVNAVTALHKEMLRSMIFSFRRHIDERTRETMCQRQRSVEGVDAAMSSADVCEKEKRKEVSNPRLSTAGILIPFDLMDDECLGHCQTGRNSVWQQMETIVEGTYNYQDNDQEYSEDGPRNQSCAVYETPKSIADYKSSAPYIQAPDAELLADMEVELLMPNVQTDYISRF